MPLNLFPYLNIIMTKDYFGQNLIEFVIARITFYLKFPQYLKIIQKRVVEDR